MTKIEDSLLALTSYPDATPDYIVDQAVDFSKLMGARLSALIFVLNRNRLARMHSMGEWLIDVSSLVDEAVQRSATEATRLLAYFENVAKRRDVFEKSLSEQTSIFPSPNTIAGQARVYDVTFLPIPKQVGLDELNSETVIFGSGRPTILLPAMADYKPKPASLDIIAVAWDFSRSAARALADAMPILERAKRVHIFTVVDEKPMPEKLNSERLERHLLLHGVDATLERVEADGRDIGRVIEGFVAANHADLLVMGAFGHSRMMEFILGGATRSILNHPPVPVSFRIRFSGHLIAAAPARLTPNIARVARQTMSAFDSTITPSSALAAQIVASLEKRSGPSAFNRLRSNFPS